MDTVDLQDELTGRSSIEQNGIKNSIAKRSPNLDILSLMGFNFRGYNRGFGGFGSFPSLHGGYGGGYGYGGTVFTQNPSANVDDQVGRYEDIIDIDIMGPSINDFAIDDSASFDSFGGGDYGGSSY
jgi:hypothetical protein